MTFIGVSLFPAFFPVYLSLSVISLITLLNSARLSYSPTRKTQRDIYITYLSCAEAVKSRCVFVIVKSNGNNSWISFYLLQIFPHAYLDSLSWYITWRLMDTKWFQSDEPVIFPPSYLRYPWILHNSHFGLSRWICWVPNGQTPKHYILHFP